VEVEKIVSATIAARMLGSIDAKTPIEQLASDRAFRDVLFRWPAYPHQERRVLLELFDDPLVRKALRGVLPSGPKHAFTQRGAGGNAASVTRCHFWCHDDVASPYGRSTTFFVARDRLPAASVASTTSRSSARW
jgi:hypothetical protein